MPETASPIRLTPKEQEEPIVLLNITLRASADDPTFAGRFPAGFLLRV